MATKVDANTENSLMLAMALLIKNRPFFGMALQHTTRIWDEATPTASINMLKELRINPHLWNRLSKEAKQVLLEHEILHPILRHPLRGWDICEKFENPMERKHHLMLCNIAADVVIHGKLEENGRKLDEFDKAVGDYAYQIALANDPNAKRENYGICTERSLLKQGIQLPAPAASLTMEEVYNAMLQAMEEQGKMPKFPSSMEDLILSADGTSGEAGDGGQGNSVGFTPEEIEAFEKEWEKIAQDSLNASQIAGDKALGMDRAAGFVNPPISWEELLMRCLRKRLSKKVVRTYSTPNRRMAGLGGVIMKGRMNPKEDKKVCLWIDTSGSIADETLNMVVGMIMTAGEDIQLTKYCHDTRIYPVENDTNNYPKFKGFGGTDFRPVFQKIQEDGDKFDLHVWVSDGYGTFPSIFHPAHQKVVWVLVNPYDFPHPFSFYNSPLHKIVVK